MSSLIQMANDALEERKALVEEAHTLVITAAKEKRQMTAAEDERWNRLHKEAEAKKETADKLKRQRDADAEFEASQVSRATTVANPGDVKGQIPAALRTKVFGHWARGKLGELDAEGERAAKKMGVTSDMKAYDVHAPRKQPRSVAQVHEQAEERAQSIATATKGPELIPEGFWPALEVARLAHGGVRRVCTVIRTNRGNKIPYPTMNDTTNKGELLGENTTVNAQDVAFAAVELDAYKYSSKIVLVPVELMVDSEFEMGGILGEALGTRLERIVNEHATTGTGSSQPNGIVTASTVGVTAASATAIAWSELLDLKHSVGVAYRMPGMSKWMFNDSTLLALKKLVDGDNRPLWQAGVAVGDPDRVDGDEYVINQDMASIATGNRSVLYGAMSKYFLRDVRGMRLIVLRERYADADQVGFLAWSRHDGDLIDAGTNPVKCLVQA